MRVALKPARAFPEQKWVVRHDVGHAVPKKHTWEG